MDKQVQGVHLVAPEVEVDLGLMDPMDKKEPKVEQEPLVKQENKEDLVDLVILGRTDHLDQQADLETRDQRDDRVV